MTLDRPPRIATWLLEHLAPGPRNESLAGDLLEELRSGRTAGWYWRQAIDAIVIACSRQFLNHATAMLYAMVWTTLVPAWLRAIGSIEQRFNLSQRFGQMDWPWSILFDWGLLLAANLFFLGAGIAIFHLPHLWAARKLSLRPLTHGLLASAPTLLTVWAALVVLPKIFPLQNAANSLDSSPAASAVPHLQVAAMVVRLPFFLVILAALWGTASHHTNHGVSLST